MHETSIVWGSPVGEIHCRTQWELQQGSILLELPSHAVDCSVAGLQVAYQRRRGVRMEDGNIIVSDTVVGICVLAGVYFVIIVHSWWL